MIEKGDPDWFQAFGQVGLFISLLMAFLLPPFLGGSTLALHLFVILSLAFVLVTTIAFKRPFRILAPLAFVELFATAQLMITETPDAIVFFYISSAIFFAALVVSFVIQLFSETNVNGKLLLASVNIYFALGIVFAMIFGLIDQIAPGSFSVTASVPDGPNSTDFMYFSLVTLSTLGYGDILPLSDQARTLAAVEALAGQVYLTIAVARLVGLHVSRSHA
jgi:voltage-gated potassium channel Kch